MRSSPQRPNRSLRRSFIPATVPAPQYILFMYSSSNFPSIKAKRNNRYLIGGIDYVGGLEFDYIIIIGVDDNRVLPKQHQKNKDFHFSNYAWHRRMYVALTRARFGVLMIGDKVYGHSYMFENAMHNKFIEYSE